MAFLRTYSSNRPEAALRRIPPMLATTATLPSEADRYGFEYKWDGIRAVLYWNGRTLTIESRNGIDITRRYPELRGIGEQLGRRRAVLDGEIIVLNSRGVPEFGALQQRMHLTDPREIERVSARHPAVYMIFDILSLDGRSTVRLPYERRRELLETLRLQGIAWQTPGWLRGAGTVMLDSAVRAGLEGIVAKRLDSPYEPGRRSGTWLKIKGEQRQELVVAGYLPGRGSLAGSVGSLLLGYYERVPQQKGPGRFRFAGNVGTGMSTEERARLKTLLDRHRLDASPFDEKIPKRGVVFSKPRLVAEISFHEWTKDGRLRHPVYKGLRSDKKPTEVVREDRS